MNIKKLIYFHLLIIGISLGITLTMKANIDVVTFALEGACKAISDKYQLSFSSLDNLLI